MHSSLSHCTLAFFYLFYQAEDGIRYLVRSRGLGDVYKRQGVDDHARTLLGGLHPEAGDAGDRDRPVHGGERTGVEPVEQAERRQAAGHIQLQGGGAVPGSYTHLMLPTIYYA